MTRIQAGIAAIALLGVTTCCCLISIGGRGSINAIVGWVRVSPFSRVSLAGLLPGRLEPGWVHGGMGGVGWVDRVVGLAGRRRGYPAKVAGPLRLPHLSRGGVSLPPAGRRRGCAWRRLCFAGRPMPAAAPLVLRRRIPFPRFLAGRRGGHRGAIFFCWI